MISPIFENMVGFEVSQTVGHVRTTTSQGIIRNELFAPNYFRFKVTMPMMYKPEFNETLGALTQLRCGAAPLLTQVPHKHLMTGGLWSGGGFSIGNTTNSEFINIHGFTPNTPAQVMAGDFIQIAGDSKVYQALNTASSNGSGSCFVRLNSLPSYTLQAGAAVRRGEDCVFLLLLDSMFSIAAVPGYLGDPLFSVTAPLEFKEYIMPYERTGGEATQFFENWTSSLYTGLIS